LTIGHHITKENYLHGYHHMKLKYILSPFNGCPWRTMAYCTIALVANISVYSRHHFCSVANGRSQ
jgi:hypothetical protein